MSDEKKQSLFDRLAKGRADMIRRAREERGWSQAELADRAGTSQQTVDRIERGETANSRALPSVMKTLQLDHKGLNPHLNKPVDEILQSVQDADLLLQALNGFSPTPPRSGELPVFSFRWEGQKDRLSPHPIDSIPRGYPVSHSSGAYGILAIDDEMSPAIRAGDIVVVNPNLPPMPDMEVFVSKTVDGYRHGMLRSLIEVDDRVFVASTWSPAPKLTTLELDEWPRVEAIVAKISRNR